VLLVTALLPRALSGADSFLLPGVTFRDADFTVGTWCEYAVVDEVLGERDSTFVRIAVTGAVVDRGGGKSVWLELETGPADAPPGGREIAKALISLKIKNLQPGDSLYQYVSRLYIKRGTGSVERADPADMDRLTSSNPTSESDWVLTPDVAVETPAGRFVCVRKSRTVLDRREIPMGRTTLVKNDADIFDAWFCENIPVFRLARCEIERVRESKTVPAIPGIPDKGRGITRTTVELTAYGTGAIAARDIE
jgi:hypothetical protein